MSIARTITLASVIAMLSATGIAHAAKDAAPAAAPTAAVVEAPKAAVTTPDVKKVDSGKKAKHHAKKHHGKKHMKPA